ncbi:GNAT superfamily N-acetyltransferase [Chryseobacterium defluvii]|uniref:GNAT superfamily N-acetyltransferase n=1 Tax=Chryseobacterium defluvii TaxID=160396 RepID=A0A840KGC1_9FLAO|nr:GNAT family N-acetyltransferase [Chryseobacterium defluvii]MBB4807715.1 GNAT superfamily N-acetyltransferase [Chryseobacterium defluvii]
MIHLKTFNKKELAEFVSSGDFRKYDFLPITEQRAKSQIRNPKADDEQALLILAFDDDRLAGYLGCFPDHFLIDGNPVKYAWLSTIYVSNEFRGKRIAQTLLNKAFEEYNGAISITEFTKEAESLYNKIGVFQYIESKKGKRYYFRSDLATVIPSKKPETKPMKPLFRITDLGINSLLSVKNYFSEKPDFTFEILDKIDTESAEFISRFKSNRNAAEINWIMENPWVLEGKSKEEKYLFSNTAQVFRYHWVKIYDHHGVLETCSLLFIRDGHLKIPYLFSNSDLTLYIDFLSYFIIEKKIKTLTSYQTTLNEKIITAKGFPKIYERDFERRYMFHKRFFEKLPENFTPYFQDGDGDCAMT